MMKDNLLPITFESWDIINKKTYDIIFHRVNFLEEFGPWKKGEYCHSVRVLFAAARIQELRLNGAILKDIPISIQPK